MALGTEFKVYLNHEFARMPIKAYPSDAGYDISACEYDEVLARQWKAIKTGVHFDIPNGWEIQIRPRSGLALKKGITILNSPSTIDEGFTGEIVVILHNTGEYPFTVSPGDRIAQLVFQPVYATFITELCVMPTSGVRGGKGFGSSGVSADP